MVRPVGSTAFLLVTIGQRAAPFLTLIVVSPLLAPQEFASIAVQAAVFTLMSMVSGLGQETVAHRLHASGDRGAMAASLRLGTLAPLAWACLLALATVVSQGNEMVGVSDVAMLLTVAAAACYVVGWQWPSTYLRREGRDRAYLGLSAAYVVLTNATKGTMALLVDRGEIGWGVGDLLGASILLFAMAKIFPVEVVWQARSSGAHTKPLLGLGLPLTFTQVCRWATSFADRFVLAALLPATSLAAYFLASQVAVVGNVVALETARYLQASIGPDSDPVDLAKRAASLIATPAVLLIVACGLWQATGLSTYDSAPLVALALSVNMPLLTLNYLGMDLCTIGRGRAAVPMAAAAMGAGVAVVLALLLVPAFDLWGAVAASVAAQLAMAAVLWTALGVGRPGPPRIS